MTLLNIPKINENVRLFDFYGDLLTEKQQRFFKLYYFHDLSLGEIAEELKVSRQAVYDIIKRTENILQNYEKKLGLWKKFQENEKTLLELKAVIEKTNIEANVKDAIFSKLESMLC